LRDFIVLVPQGYSLCLLSAGKSFPASATNIYAQNQAFVKGFDAWFTKNHDFTQNPPNGALLTPPVRSSSRYYNLMYNGWNFYG
jgi:hypothetical protein